MNGTRFTPDLIEEYLATKYWDRETRADIWDGNAVRYPDREALVDSRARMTWAEAKTATDRLALGFLELGIKRDEVVVCQLPKCMESILLRIAAAKAGILMHPARQPSEFEYVLKATEAVAVVGPLQGEAVDWVARVEALRPGLPSLRHILVVTGDALPGTVSIREMMEQPLEKRYPRDYLKQRGVAFADVATIGTTGGSTGTPKLVEWADAPMMGFGRVLARRLNMSAEDTVALLDAPLHYMANACMIETVPTVGARFVMMDSSDLWDALKLIEREKATIAAGASVTLIQLIRHPDFEKHDLSSLKVFFWAGPLPFDIAREAEEKLKCPLVSCYGSADAGVITLASLDTPRNVRLLTAGKPMEGMEIRLVNEEGEEVASGEAGEVLVRGPYCHPGYFKKPEATLQAWGKLGQRGWFKTGDMGKLDKDQNLIILGRRVDVISSQGQSIYPVEIESLLSGHSRVSLASVVGVPDSERGAKICACVVLQPGASLTLEEMNSFLEEAGLASLKLPHRLEILDKLPTTGDGLKISKKALVEYLSQELAHPPE